LPIVLKFPIYEALLTFKQNRKMAKKTGHFVRKWPLFAEKQQNKFALDLKKNKFVFN